MLQVAIYTVYVVAHLRYGIGHFLIVHRCAGSLLLHSFSVVGGRGLINLAFILAFFNAPQIIPLIWLLISEAAEGDSLVHPPVPESVSVLPPSGSPPPLPSAHVNTVTSAVRAVRTAARASKAAKNVAAVERRDERIFHRSRDSCLKLQARRGFLHG